jgi:hypothetical protein
MWTGGSTVYSDGNGDVALQSYDSTSNTYYYAKLGQAGNLVVTANVVANGISTTTGNITTLTTNAITSNTIVTTTSNAVNATVSGTLDAGALSVGGSMTVGGTLSMQPGYVVDWSDGGAIYSDSAPNSGDVVIRTYNATSNTYYYNSFSNTGSLAVPVNITAGGNITSDSDIKLKQNITHIDDALDKILSIKGVEFDWKKDNRHSIGVIAQNVREVFPELVIEQENTLSVDYSKLVAPLIEAIRHLNNKITRLEKKLKNGESS